MKIFMALGALFWCLIAADTASAADPTLVYGRYTCKQGYVWREAMPGDKICVPPPIRDTTRRDNARAASRVAPNGGAYGAETCRLGFVWREATPNDSCRQCRPDRVCVTGDVRTRTREENRFSNAFPRYQNFLCAYGAFDAGDLPEWEAECRGVPE